MPEQIELLPSETAQEELNRDKLKRILTPETWKYLQEGYFSARWLKFHPFAWDSVVNAPVVGSKRLFWLPHFVSALLFYALLLSRMIEVTVIRPGNYTEQFYVLFVNCYYSVFMLLQVNGAFRCERVVSLMQGFLLLIRKCEGNFNS